MFLRLLRYTITTVGLSVIRHLVEGVKLPLNMQDVAVYRLKAVMRTSPKTISIDMLSHLAGITWWHAEFSIYSKRVHYTRSAHERIMLYNIYTLNPFGCVLTHIIVNGLTTHAPVTHMYPVLEVYTLL